MNRCADCGQNLHWRTGLPLYWVGPRVYRFCSLPCHDRFRFRAAQARPLPLHAA